MNARAGGAAALFLSVSAIQRDRKQCDIGVSGETDHSLHLLKGVEDIPKPLLERSLLGVANIATGGELLKRIEWGRSLLVASK